MINKDLNQMIDGADVASVEQPISTDLSPAEDSVFTGENIQVAGLGKIGEKIIEKTIGGATKKVIQRETKPVVKKVIEKTPAQQVKELAVGAERKGISTQTEAKKAGKVQQLMNEEPQISVEDLQKTVDEVKPKIESTQERINQLQTDVDNNIPGAKEELAKAKSELKPSEDKQFNLPLISENNDLQAVVDAVTQQAGIKTQNITFDDIVASAKAAGMDDTFISKLTDGSITVNPTNTYRALEAQRASADHLETLLRKFKENPEQVTPEMELEAMQTISFNSLIQRSVKNYQTNVAQSLAVMRIPRAGVISLEDATNGLMSKKDLMKFADAFLTEKDAAKRAALIDSTAKTGWRDKTFSVFVNNILSRPSTHIKNSLSNMIMMPIRGTEKSVASVIGTARRAMGIGEDDQYFLSETYSSLSATWQAIKDGLEMGKFAAKEGYSSTMDDASKIDLAKARTEIFDYEADSPLAGFWKSANFVATLPGRSLLTADEFFKGMSYRYELERTATREGIKAYENAIETGTKADADKAFESAVQNIYDNPPDELIGAAQEATFTKPLDGFAKKVQNVINDDSYAGFLARTQIPFVTTPINLNLQVLERTPLAALSKRIRADIAKGGKEGDLALAKISMGTGVGMLFSSYAADGKITGAGPADKGQREALIRQGWQPYSMVYDASGMTEEQRKSFATMPVDVRYGTGDYAGKVFISYQGMEPVGAFMAMAANYNEYGRYENDNSKINAAAAGLAYGFYDYMMSSPFLQGLSNISSALGVGPQSNQDQTMKMFDELGKSLVTFAGKTVVPLSGLVTSVREHTDPYRRDYKIDPNAESILPAGVREGINELMNSTPGLSDKLPPKLNLWGEPVEYQYSWSPIRMSQGKQTEADQVIIQTGVKVKMPTRKLSQQFEKGLSVEVDLNTQEYNEMLRIANDPSGIDLQNQIVNVSKDISGLPLYQQQSIIGNIISQSFSKAKKVLLSNSEYSADIQDRIQQRADIIREVGQGAK